MQKIVNNKFVTVYVNPKSASCEDRNDFIIKQSTDRLTKERQYAIAYIPMMFMPNFDYTLKDLPTATYYEFVTMKECLDSIILQCTKLFKTSDKLTIEITDIISKQTLSFNIFNGVIQKRKSPILKLFHSHILTRNNAFKSNIKLEVEFRDIVLDLFTMEFSDLIEKWSKILDAKIL